MFRTLWLESRAELLKLWRTPGFVLPTILFPVMFYLLFGVAMANKSPNGTAIGTYLLASYGCFGILGTCMFGFGATVAQERDQGWFIAKRITPLPSWIIFAAKTAMCLLFGCIILILLSLCGRFLANVHLQAAQWMKYFVLCAASVLPFATIGLAIGFGSNGKAAPAIANLIYLPLSFASGLWIPIHMLPAFLKSVAPALPPYHVNQLLLTTLSMKEGPWEGHALYLLLFTAIMTGLVLWLFRRDQNAL